MRYLEDFVPGDVIDLGRHTITEPEIVAFATEFDPQPFHVDAAAAVRSPFGGLIASGWHSVCLFMRLYVDVVLADSAALGSPGVEELRWRVPVRPGDALTGRVRIVEVSPSPRHPERGTVVMEASLVNQDLETVMTMTARGLFGRRPA